jgi:hypothetical protein
MRPILRIRHSEPSVPEGLEPLGREAALPEAPERDGHLTALLKLVPAEAATLYTAGQQVAADEQFVAGWAILCLVLCIVFRAYTSRSEAPGLSFLARPQWSSVIVSAVSFAIWIYASGGHLPGLTEVGNGIVTLLMLLWVVASPLIEKGLNQLESHIRKKPT